MTDLRQRKVLIVDDSRTIRALLRVTLETDPRLTVVGEAADPFEAREKIKALSPDVITLDVEMPRMSGLEFLEKLMRLRPMPVVMVSTRTKEKSEVAVRALAMGAVDCVDVARVQADPEQRRRLVETLVVAASARVRARGGGVPPLPADRGPREEVYRWNGRVVLIGSSTGGVDAIERVLGAFPADGPPVIIAQHMPAPFLKSFASRLNEQLDPEVRLARDGDTVDRGRVLIAPGGDAHLQFARGARMQMRLAPADGPELYVPSVDRLFNSATGHAPTVVSVVLTGMGRDGADGMAALRESGARTLAQSGETCVVDGMPRAARDAGAVMRSVPIDDLGAAILEECSVARRVHA